MTRLPLDDRNVIDRPDLPEYELNTYCAVKGCNEAREIGGGHHAWRRSFGTKSWWVQLPDGTVVGNRIGLCPGHHYAVTVNKSRLVYEFGDYWYVEGDRKGYQLAWQPPAYPGDTNVSENLETDYSVGGHEQFETPTMVVAQPKEGEECKLCKRRVPHKKKATSPKTKVASIRVPIDDAETFDELIDAAAEHMGAKAKPHHKWSTIVVGLALILQTPKEQLP